ncbi:MAG: hypothetical protein ACR5K7_03560 [Symbiopectobacterium sp.]
MISTIVYFQILDLVLTAQRFGIIIIFNIIFNAAIGQFTLANHQRTDSFWFTESERKLYPMIILWVAAATAANIKYIVITQRGNVGNNFASKDIEQNLGIRGSVKMWRRALLAQTSICIVHWGLVRLAVRQRDAKQGIDIKATGPPIALELFAVGW